MVEDYSHEKRHRIVDLTEQEWKGDLAERRIEMVSWIPSSGLREV